MEIKKLIMIMTATGNSPQLPNLMIQELMIKGAPKLQVAALKHTHALKATT